VAEWTWHGMPGHFIGWRSCCFRLHTTVGRFRVSTVGCYHPPGSPDEPQPIGAGADALYETMVFALDEDGEVVDWAESDGERYATAEAAEAGHLRYCQQAAAHRRRTMLAASTDDKRTRP
jgi:hypothetical protein